MWKKLTIASGLIIFALAGEALGAVAVPAKPAPVAVHQWLDAFGGPLIEFNGAVHDLSIPVVAQDVRKPIAALQLIIATGDADLRDGDDCDVTLVLASSHTIVLPNVNEGAAWRNGSVHVVSVDLPPGGLKGGDITAIRLHTGFGRRVAAKSWDVESVQLQATVAN